MSLTLALNNALTSLNVNQRAMAVLSHNIANANTAGYSRQVLDLASVTYDGIGQGVRIEDVVRKVDEFLLTAISRQSSHVGEADIVNEYMERMQLVMGDPSAQNSIDSQIETFFNRLQSMAESPERTSTRTAVVDAAINMAREISNLAYNIEQLRMQADTDIDIGVKNINTALQKLYILNEAITHADAFGAPKATLYDQRDEQLRILSEYMDIRTHELENGVTHIYVGAGLPLLDENLHELSYSKANTLEIFVNDSELSSIEVISLSPDGDEQGQPFTLVSGGKSSEVTRLFNVGKLAGLLQLRDEIFPNMLEQVDTLANVFRDTFNEVHNKGTGFPPASELTGTREIVTSERIRWEGSVRIAALDSRGQPADSGYSDELSGLRPLTLNLDTIFNGLTFGEPTTGDIIKEINNHFGAPAPRLTLGNLNQIQLALSSDNVPGATPIISFDFDLENISDEDADFWVSSIQVLDDTATDITSFTDTMPEITLSAGSTFTTTALSDLVVVTATTPHGLQVGDRVKMNDPGVAVDGIPGAQFDDYFVVQAVSGNTFTIQLPSLAGVGGITGVVAQTASPPFGTAYAGTKTRLQQNGSISANLAGNINSSYYDVNVTMTVRDESGNLSDAVVTYRIASPAVNTRNNRVSAAAVVSGAAAIQTPQTSQHYLRAIMVDADGNELPRINSEYGDQSGYLKLIGNDGITVAIDELGSKHKGLPDDTPPRAGSDRGFSFFYELNNFFQSNESVDTGDTLKNSAYNMAVEDRFKTTPSLISTGNLELSNQPSDDSRDPLYTYERFAGDNSIAQLLAKIGIEPHIFTPAGGLSESSLTIGGYAAEMLGYMSAQTSTAAAKLSNQQVLLDGYQERASAISGVNLDEELGNTIIYQNAYAASAKVISTTDELFRTLLESF